MGIAGGGISDLTLADYLQHANIDFAVPEGGENFGLHPGVGVGVGPGGVRIIDQVGIFAGLEKHPAANRDTVLQLSEGRKLATMESRVLPELRSECISVPFQFCCMLWAEN